MKKITYALWAVVLIAIFSIQATNNEQGHTIEFEIKNYANTQMIVAYHQGDKQYISDTLTATKPGFFTMSGDEELTPGMYIAFFPSIGKSFEFLVNRGEQHFKLSTDTQNFVPAMQVKGSPENKLFFGYLNYLTEQRTERTGMTKLLEELKKDEAANEAKIDAIIEKAGQRVQDLKDYVKYAISVLSLNGHMPKSYDKDWKAAKEGTSEEAQALANVKKLAHNYSAHRFLHWGRKHTKVAKQLEHFVKDLQKNDDLSDEAKLRQLESKLMDLANVVREGKINVSGSMGRRVMFSLDKVLTLTQKDVTKAVEAKADKTAEVEAEAKAIVSL